MSQFFAGQERPYELGSLDRPESIIPSSKAMLPARLTGFFAAVSAFARAEMYEAMGDFGLCQHCHQPACLWCDGCHNRQCRHSTLPSRECVEIMEEA